MTRTTRGTHDLAEEIAQYLDHSLPRPAAEAASALRQARAAGNGELRQDHLTQAQCAIARLDPVQDGKLTQRLQADVLALRGRGGNNRVVHVKPGEILVPRQLQTPALMVLLADAARAAGIDPDRLRIGSSRNATNPFTGQAEFDDAMLSQEADDNGAQGFADQSRDDLNGQKDSLQESMLLPQDDSRPFKLTDILPAAKILEGEAGGLPLDRKRQVMQAMLSRAGSSTPTGGTFPSTLRNVMLERTRGNNFQFDALGHDRAYRSGGGSMTDADRASWEGSLGLAHDMIVDAIHNGVDYGNRNFNGVGSGANRDLKFSDPGYPTATPYPYPKTRPFP
jgi:hypothetical protein